MFSEVFDLKPTSGLSHAQSSPKTRLICHTFLHNERLARYRHLSSRPRRRPYSSRLLWTRETRRIANNVQRSRTRTTDYKDEDDWGSALYRAKHVRNPGLSSCLFGAQTLVPFPLCSRAYATPDRAWPPPHRRGDCIGDSSLSSKIPDNFRSISPPTQVVILP